MTAYDLVSRKGYDPTGLRTKVLHMSDDKDADIIPFPENRIKQNQLTDITDLSTEETTDLVIAIASINMATKYLGQFNEDCKENLKTKNFPCTENCGCYIHMLSSMALEIVVDGPRKEEAISAIRNEYRTLQRKGPKNKGNG